MYSEPNRQRGACLVRLTDNPWYNLAASIVIDGILAADFSFLNSEYGEFLRESIGLQSSAEYLVSVAEKHGRLYQQREDNKGSNSNIVRIRKGWGII